MTTTGPATQVIQGVRPSLGERLSVAPVTAPVSIVIVAYNSGALLRRCLTALRHGKAEVVVVDNASQNGDRDVLRREFPGVRLIEQGRNYGFGTAANIGVAATSSRWVLLLNPDAWPVGDAVEELVQFAEHDSGLGAAGPLLSRPDGRPQRSAIRAPLSPVKLAAWAALPSVVSGAYGAWRKAAPVEVRDAEFLQGSALLLRRSAFDQIGGFDESFFLYGEDADLCARLRDAGWGIELCPTARFVHVGAGSTNGDPEGMYRELLHAWLRLIVKRNGIREAERARRLLLPALWMRARRSGDAAARVAWSWLASGSVEELLDLPR